MRWMLALVVALTVVPAASARVPNACTLLTRAQAEAALGAKLQWSQRQGDNKLSSVCTFHGAPYNASAYGHPTLTLVVNRSTPARFRQAFRMSPTAFRVRGIGDDAYATGGIVRTLNVLGRGYGLMVMIPQEKTLQWAKNLAGEALTHLKA